jgi:hypothetical protein
VASVNGLSMIFIQMLIFLIGILYINNTIKTLEHCEAAKNFVDAEFRKCQMICEREDQED